MTREEQIEVATASYINGRLKNNVPPEEIEEIRLAYQAGIIYADEHPTEEVQRLKEMFKGDPDAYEQGYKDAVDKVCELIFEYNKRQAWKFGAKSTMRLSDYTINVGDFRKIMEEQQ